MYRILLSLVLACIVAPSVGQTISPPVVSYSVCSTIPLEFPVSGSFQPGNAFKAQFKNETTQTVTEVTATITDGKVVALPPEVLVDGQPYRSRLTSSSPALVSDWSYSFYVSKAPLARLLSIYPSIANVGQKVKIQVDVSGASGGAELTFSDGTQVTASAGFKESVNNIPLTVPPQTTQYSIRSAKNNCGTRAGEGSATITVNPVASGFVTVTPANICSGGSFYVNWSTPPGKELPSGAKYYVMLWTMNPADYSPDILEKSRWYELAATREGNRIKARLTSDVQEGSYYVQVKTADPATLSEITDTYLRVYAPSTVEITQTDLSVRTGETIRLTPSVTGLTPYSYTWSDGGIYDGSWEYFPAPLTRTTTFKLIDFQSVCEGAVIKPSSLTATVQPGIQIESIPQQSFCPGNEVSLPVTVNIQASGSTEYWVDFIRSRNGSEEVAASVRATLNNRNLIFPAPDIKAGTTDNRAFYLQTRTVNPSTTGYKLPNTWIRVLSTPDIYLSDFASRTLIKPENTYFSFYNLGGGPTEYRLTNGYSSYSTCSDCVQLSAQLYPTQTETIRVEYARNACGVVHNPAGSATITIQNPLSRAIRIDSTERGKCVGDSMRVWFTKIGSFETEPIFTVHADDYDGDYSKFEDVVGSGKSSPVWIKLPKGRFVRVQTGSVIGNAVLAPVDAPDQMELKQLPWPIWSSAEPSYVPAGKPVTFSINNASIPFRNGFTLTDGITDYVVENSPSATITPPQNKSTTYRLKSVRNVCGQGRVFGQQVTVTPMPFRILLAEGIIDEIRSLCAGYTISIPFVSAPIAAKGTRFVLELAGKKDSVYHELATAAESPILVKIPDNFPAGEYYLRIRDQNSTARTRTLSAVVREKPTAELKLISPPSGEILAGQSARLQVIPTGTQPVQTVFTDGARVAFYGTSYYEYKPKKGGSFAIESVSNVCGYGSPSGSVNFRVSPTLKVLNLSSFKPCAGTTIQAELEALGDFPSGENLDVILSLPTGATLKLLGTCPAVSGTYSFTVPETVTAGDYHIVFRAKNGTTTYAALTVSAPPAVTLSGSNTIVAGQPSDLLLRVNAPAGDVSITLSDGSTLSRYLDNLTTVEVRPVQTTTYTLTSIRNSCGIGTSRGSATITVRSASERSVITGVISESAVCPGKSISVPFLTTGSFSAGNTFQALLSDSTGMNFTPVQTSGSVSPLSVTIPAGTPRGIGYRLMVVASEGVSASGASPSLLAVIGKSTARFDTTRYQLLSGGAVILRFRLGGDGPWNVFIAGENLTTNSYLTTPLASMALPWAKPGVYSIRSVSNSCGEGTVLEPSQATVEDLILSVTPAGRTIRLGPNPTSGLLRVRTDRKGPHVFTITGTFGEELHRQFSTDETTVLNFAALPPGLYLLTIRSGSDDPISYRIHRQ